MDTDTIECEVFKSSQSPRNIDTEATIPTLQGKRPRLVLCLDGGGIRGIAIAQILASIEEHFSLPIYKLFDAIVGSSTGGLLALALAVPSPTGYIMTAKELLNGYIEHGPSLFDSLMLRAAVTTKHTEENLFKALKKMMSTPLMLSTAKIPVAVLTTKVSDGVGILINSEEAKLFPHSRSDITIHEAAMATGSAPHYFPAFRFHQSVLYRVSDEWESNENHLFHIKERPKYKDSSFLVEDGGLTANFPGLNAYQYCKAVYDNPNVVIFSIGAGTATGFDLAPKMVAVQKNAGCLCIVGRAVINSTITDIFGMYARTVSDIQHLRSLGIPLHRIQFRVREGSMSRMDDASMENMEYLKNVGAEVVKSKVFVNFCEELAQFGPRDPKSYIPKYKNTIKTPTALKLCHGMSCSEFFEFLSMKSIFSETIKLSTDSASDDSICERFHMPKYLYDHCNISVNDVTPATKLCCQKLFSLYAERQKQTQTVYEPAVQRSNDNIMLVAFPQTPKSQTNETITKFSSILVPIPGISGGVVQDFLSFSKKVSDKMLSEYLSLLLSTPTLHIIFTGHSLGAAFAAITFLRFIGVALKDLRSEEYASVRQRVSLITFGLPNFCDSATARWIRERQLNLQMLHFFHEFDHISTIVTTFAPVIQQILLTFAGTKIWLYTPPELSKTPSPTYSENPEGTNRNDLFVFPDLEYHLLPSYIKCTEYFLEQYNGKLLVPFYQNSKGTEHIYPETLPPPSSRFLQRKEFHLLSTTFITYSTTTEEDLLQLTQAELNRVFHNAQDAWERKMVKQKLGALIEEKGIETILSLAVTSTEFINRDITTYLIKQMKQTTVFRIILKAFLTSSSSEKSHDIYGVIRSYNVHVEKQKLFFLQHFYAALLNSSCDVFAAFFRGNQEYLESDAVRYIIERLCGAVEWNACICCPRARKTLGSSLRMLINLGLDPQKSKEFITLRDICCNFNDGKMTSTMELVMQKIAHFRLLQSTILKNTTTIIDFDLLVPNPKDSENIYILSCYFWEQITSLPTFQNITTLKNTQLRISETAREAIIETVKSDQTNISRFILSDCSNDLLSAFAQHNNAVVDLTITEIITKQMFEFVLKSKIKVLDVVLKAEFLNLLSLLDDNLVLKQIVVRVMDASLVKFSDSLSFLSKTRNNCLGILDIRDAKTGLLIYLPIDAFLHFTGLSTIAVAIDGENEEYKLSQVIVNNRNLVSLMLSVPNSKKKIISLLKMLKLHNPTFEVAVKIRPRHWVSKSTLRRFKKNHPFLKLID